VQKHAANQQPPKVFNVVKQLFICSIFCGFGFRYLVQIHYHKLLYRVRGGGNAFIGDRAAYLSGMQFCPYSAASADGGRLGPGALCCKLKP
jgi:hypothetical protein